MNTEIIALLIFIAAVIPFGHGLSVLSLDKRMRPRWIKYLLLANILAAVAGTSAYFIAVILLHPFLAYLICYLVGMGGWYILKKSGQIFGWVKYS